MWRCPYCFSEMLATSRPAHLKRKQGCSQQHALHLAEEAEKEAKAKEKRMAFFRPPEPARESAESAVGPPKAPKSTGATLGNLGAQNSNLASVSAAIHSLMLYIDSRILCPSIGERCMG